MDRMNALALVFAIAIGLGSLGATRGDYNVNKWLDLGALTNCDDAAINSAVTCGGTRGVLTEQWNVITLEIVYTRSAGTGWEFWLESCYEGHEATDCTDAADWYIVAAEETAVGTGTKLDTDPIYHDTGSSDRLTWSIPIHYSRLRLNGFQAKGTPDANDKITVHARVGYLAGP